MKMRSALFNRLLVTPLLVLAVALAHVQSACAEEADPVSSPDGQFRVSVLQKASGDDGVTPWLQLQRGDPGASFEKQYQKDLAILGRPEGVLVSNAGCVLAYGFPSTFGGIAIAILDPSGALIRTVSLDDLKIDAADPDLEFTTTVGGLRWGGATLAYCIGTDFRLVFLNRMEVTVSIEDRRVEVVQAMSKTPDRDKIIREDAGIIQRLLTSGPYEKRLSGMKFYHLFSSDLPATIASEAKAAADQDEGVEVVTFTKGGQPIKSRQYELQEAYHKVP